MPDSVYAYVTNKANYERYNELLTTATEAEINAYLASIAGEIDKYKANVIWTGGSLGRVTVYYNDTERATSMTMPIDDQTYRFRFNVQPWLFNDTEGAIDAFEDTTPYGPDDIILLPTSSGLTQELNSKFYIKVIYNTDDSGHPIYDAMYGYEMHYTINGEEKVVTVYDVNGGGSYRDNYNKWYFGAVKFGYSNQYATITLGGKGGQTFRWKFHKTSTRQWINSNVPSLIALSPGNEINLPSNLIQYFGQSNSYVIETTPAEYYIPIEYLSLEKPLNDSRYDIIASADFTQNKLTVHRSSPATIQSLDFGREKDEDGNEGAQIVNPYQIALLNWQAAGRRAYPSPSTKIGGAIVVSGYGSVMPWYVYETDKGLIASIFKSDDNVGFNRIYVSDALNSKHYLLPPNTEEEIEGASAAYNNANVSLDSGYRYSDDMYNSMALDLYYVDNNGHATSRIPTLYVKRGTPFAVHNLPLFQLNLTFSVKTDTTIPGINWTIGSDYSAFSAKTSIYIPWQNAQVYSFSGSLNIQNGVPQNATLLTGGLGSINTNASVGTKYLLAVSFSINMSTITDAEEMYNTRPTDDTSAPSKSEAKSFTVYTILQVSNR